MPAIECADGSLLAEPSNAELARKLGLRTEVPRTFWPLIVAGAGPAGLTAALCAARDAIDALLIENGQGRRRPAALAVSAYLKAT